MWVGCTGEGFMERLKNGLYLQCYVAAWIGGEFGEDWIHVCVWLSPFAVHCNHYNIVNQLYSSIK